MIYIDIPYIFHPKSLNFQVWCRTISRDLSTCRLHFLHVNTFLMKGHSMSEQNRRRYLANIDSFLDCSCTFLRKDIRKNLLRFGFSFIFFLNISFEQENIKHLGYRIIKPFTNYSLIQKQRVGKIFRTNTKNIIFFISIKLHTIEIILNVYM